MVNIGDGTPGPDFAALAPLINELAEAGDAVALGVLKQAAADLVEFVLLVRDKLKKNHEPDNRGAGAKSRWRGRVA